MEAKLEELRAEVIALEERHAALLTECEAGVGASDPERERRLAELDTVDEQRTTVELKQAALTKQVRAGDDSALVREALSGDFWAGE